MADSEKSVTADHSSVSVVTVKGTVHKKLKFHSFSTHSDDDVGSGDIF